MFRFAAARLALNLLPRLATAMLACCLLAAAAADAEEAEEALFSYDLGQPHSEVPPPSPDPLAPLEPETYVDPAYGDVYWPEPWQWVFLPEGLIYRSYLAGVKESRFGSVWFHEKDQGALWDVALGGRVGLLRFGNDDCWHPEGWQLDIEGAAFPRLDPDPNRDVVSTDFRFGIPLTYGEGPYQTKFAYYHLSSHLGDEFLLKNPGIRRVNYSRDAFVLGLAAYATDHVRFYGEAGYAFANSGGSEPWEFQFGAELSPVTPNYVQGAPFAAVNAHLREEVDFSGTLTVQAGWQWRGYGSHHLFRLGAQYLTGKSPQFQFNRNNEEQIAFALWYDY